MKHLEAQQYTRWGAAGLAGLPLARAQTRVAETRELLEWARATWSRARTEIAGQLLRLDRVSRYQSPGPAPRFQLPSKQKEAAQRRRLKNPPKEA